MLIQEYSSKFTSVNSTKLPAIFSKIKWRELREIFPTSGRPTVLDYGCGRERKLVQELVESFGFKYLGYDPNWLSDEENELALHSQPQIIVCTNTLNVIPDWEAQSLIHLWIRNQTPFYFISVWEGNRSKVGKQSKKDCWQWNRPLEDYFISQFELTKNRVITSVHGFDFVK